MNPFDIGYLLGSLGTGIIILVAWIICELSQQEEE